MCDIIRKSGDVDDFFPKISIRFNPLPAPPGPPCMIVRLLEVNFCVRYMTMEPCSVVLIVLAYIAYAMRYALQKLVEDSDPRGTRKVYFGLAWLVFWS